MTTYKAIRGLTIQTVAGDPSPLTTGDIWYSSTAKKIRGAKLAAGAWASGAAMNTARDSSAGSGIGTAGLVFAGSPETVITESYDGSSWTEVADLSAGREGPGGIGTQTAALCIGGFGPRSSVILFHLC